MTVEWGSFWVGFVTFPLAALVIAGTVTLAFWLASKNRGIGGCQVCDQSFTCDIGEYTRLGIWFRTRRHAWFISSQRWHREAWAQNRWNPYRAPGFGDDGGTAAPRRRRPNVFHRAWWFIFG